MAVKDLIRVQTGKETTWGTAVPATSWLTAVQSAEFSIDDEVKAISAAGSLAPAAIAAQVRQGAKGKIKAALTYEDILYALHGIFGSVAPSGTGPYTWTYTAPRESVPTPQAYTLEFGQSDAAYRAVGALFSSLSIVLAAGEIGTLEADVIAKQLESVTLTSGLARRAQTLVRGADAKLYIDPWGGMFGATQVPATLIEAELGVETGRHLKYFADGDILASAYGDARWKAELKITAEFNASAKALVDALLAGEVKRLVRIKCTSGDNMLTLNFPGVITDGATLWKDRDGNCVVELAFGALDATDGPDNWLEISAVNAVAMLV